MRLVKAVVCALPNTEQKYAGYQDLHFRADTHLPLSRDHASWSGTSRRRSYHLRSCLPDSRRQDRTAIKQRRVPLTARARAIHFQTPASNPINMNLVIINAFVSFFAALVLHELGHYFA